MIIFSKKHNTKEKIFHLMNINEIFMHIKLDFSKIFKFFIFAYFFKNHKTKNNFLHLMNINEIFMHIK